MRYAATLKETGLGPNAEMMEAPLSGSYVRFDEHVAEVLDLRAQISTLESREVCAAAHDNVETCGYCQRDALLIHIQNLNITFAKAHMAGAEASQTLLTESLAHQELVRRYKSALNSIVDVFNDESESGDSDTMLRILGIAERALAP